MCTIEHDENFELPTEHKITVYKIFGNSRVDDCLYNFTMQDSFKIGKNVWNSDHINMQLGFQVFVEEQSAIDWVKSYQKVDLVIPVTIFKKDIVKASGEFNFDLKDHKVFEVKAFTLRKKDWIEARKKADKRYGEL